MAAFSDYLENELLDHTLGTAAYTAPATVYIALFTTATNDAGGGTEAAWTSYARQSAAFSAAAGGTTSNSAEIAFPAVDTGDGPVTVTHMGIFDAATAGNLLYHGALGTSKTLQDDDVLKFSAGDIDVTLA